MEDEELRRANLSGEGLGYTYLGEVKRRLEEIYEFARACRSDYPQYAICARLREEFPGVFKDYVGKVYHAIPPKPVEK